MFACNGILFNHESPIRGETFVSRKITRGIAKIALGMQDKLYMGNLNAKRDWGHAKDYVCAMWLMLQQDVADDFVIATGITTSVREFIRLSFAELGIEIIFKGKDEHEKGFVASCSNNAYRLEEGREVVCIDKRYYRPSEVDILMGDATKAKDILGWKPVYDLPALISEMMQADVELFSREKLLKEAGYTVRNQYE
jgi:GDPmannose 4,6-dehydratase